MCLNVFLNRKFESMYYISKTKIGVPEKRAALAHSDKKLYYLKMIIIKRRITMPIMPKIANPFITIFTVRFAC